jgi:purine-binding chemotaxis protein CheW
MSEKAQYVTLGVDGEIFALPIEQVQEILDSQPISKLPQAPANLLGMTDVRGEGIAVLDLRLTLGMPAAVNTENTRIVVLKLETPDRLLTVGLRTDRVFEVTSLDEAELGSPPDVTRDWKDHAVAGIGRRNGAFVSVLDLDRLIIQSTSALAA